MFRNLAVLSATFLLLASCSTPSAYTERKFLEGDPMPEEKAKTIFDALKRNDSLKKESIIKSSGKKTTISTGVEVEIAPFTRPLVVARAREKIEELAFKERWDEKKKESAIQAYIKKYQPNGKEQCFDLTISYATSVVIDGVTPKQLDLQYWYGTVTQNGVSKEFSIDKNPICAIQTTKTATTYGISTSRSYYCPSTACAKIGLDLTKPFQVALDIRYEKGLVPLVLEWKGVKE